MSVDVNELMRDLVERREIASRRYLEEPLPSTDAEARESIRNEIEKLDLARNVVDLEINGYTILPPGKAAPQEFTDRLRDTILNYREELSARNMDTQIPLSRGFGHQIHHALPVDPIFQEAVMNPVTLALVTYLAGYRAKISSTTALVKSNDSDAPLFWHSDMSHRLAPPHPILSSGANVNWMLTDYSRENGALCVVPGSHTWGRGPDAGLSYEDPRVKVIEAPAGSVAVWHTNLWHGALPRTAPGDRVSFINFYLRPYMQIQEATLFSTTREMLENNPPRFGVITGVVSDMIYGEEGPDAGGRVAFPAEFGRWV